MQRLYLIKLIFAYFKSGEIERVISKNISPSSPYLCSKNRKGSGPSSLTIPKKKYRGIGISKIQYNNETGRDLNKMLDVIILVVFF